LKLGKKTQKLTSRYNMPPPIHLKTKEEFQKFLEEKLFPTRREILFITKFWIEKSFENDLQNDFKFKFKFSKFLTNVEKTMKEEGTEIRKIMGDIEKNFKV
jgi:hypothetical protein